MTMKLGKIFAVLFLFATIWILSGTHGAEAGTTCTTRKSGSVSITTCSGGRFQYSQCRAYRSGSVIKTSCRR